MNELCVCGDTVEQHVDNMEQCIIPECGCKAYEVDEELVEARETYIAITREFSPEQEIIINKLKEETPEEE